MKRGNNNNNNLVKQQQMCKQIGNNCLRSITFFTIVRVTRVHFKEFDCNHLMFAGPTSHPPPHHPDGILHRISLHRKCSTVARHQQHQYDQRENMQFGWFGRMHGRKSKRAHNIFTLDWCVRTYFRTGKNFFPMQTNEIGFQFKHAQHRARAHTRARARLHLTYAAIRFLISRN